MTRINTGELKYASAYDIVEALTTDESEIEAFFDWLSDGSSWTWGDTRFSLVANTEFLSALESFFGEEITDRYWEVIPEYHYINLDG